MKNITSVVMHVIQKIHGLKITLVISAYEILSSTKKIVMICGDLGHSTVIQADVVLMGVNKNE